MFFSEYMRSALEPHAWDAKRIVAIPVYFDAHLWGNHASCTNWAVFISQAASAHSKSASSHMHAHSDPSCLCGTVRRGPPSRPRTTATLEISISV